MPIYEYECASCGNRFELLKSKMVKNSTETCPKCGKSAKQQLSSFGVGSSTSSCEGASAQQGCYGGSCKSGTCPFSGN